MRFEICEQDRPQRILFVTGRFADSSLRRVVRPLSDSLDFDFRIEVLGITVAALMHVDWVRKNLRIEGVYDRVILPGWCQGELSLLSEHFGVPFERGPKDLFDLPEYLGHGPKQPVDLTRYDIEIIAEINHAPSMSDTAILAAAKSYRDAGADVIDVGCIPGESWSRAGAVTRLLRTEGFRVSVDSFDRGEIDSAVEAGAELVLSSRSDNAHWFDGVPAEVVVIPDHNDDVGSMQRTIEVLESQQSAYRLDPIIEPIGFGFARSLARYHETRQRWPNAKMMMGIGNVTELTEVDSAGVNMLLAAICQELGVLSVLTTQVINWCRTAVAEFDVARRLVKHSIDNMCLPKHLDSRLTMLRDPRVISRGLDELEEFAVQLRDAGFRVFVDSGEIHLMNRRGHWRGTDPYVLFDAAAESTKLTPSHAFYLGHELSKARIALTLGKQYVQDQALQWGLLTQAEESALDRRRGEFGTESTPKASEPHRG